MKIADPYPHPISLSSLKESWDIQDYNVNKLEGCFKRDAWTIQKMEKYTYRYDMTRILIWDMDRILCFTLRHDNKREKMVEGVLLL